MFDVDLSELAVCAVVALIVVGPKDLPKLMRTVGHWTGRARGMVRHVRSGFDTMMREAEIDELNRQWDKQNQAIMAATRSPVMPDPFASSPPADAAPPPAPPSPAPNPAP